MRMPVILEEKSCIKPAGVEISEIGNTLAAGSMRLPRALIVVWPEAEVRTTLRSISENRDVND